MGGMADKTGLTRTAGTVELDQGAQMAGRVMAAIALEVAVAEPG